MLLEALAPVGTAHIPPDIHLESPPVQVMGPAPEAPVAEACIPQGGPQELSYGAAGECQPFLDPGKARALFPFLGLCLRAPELCKVGLVKEHHLCDGNGPTLLKRRRGCLSWNSWAKCIKKVR